MKNGMESDILDRNRKHRTKNINPVDTDSETSTKETRKQTGGRRMLEAPGGQKRQCISFDAYLQRFT